MVASRSVRTSDGARHACAHLEQLYAHNIGRTYEIECINLSVKFQTSRSIIIAVLIINVWINTCRKCPIEMSMVSEQISMCIQTHISHRLIR